MHVSGHRQKIWKLFRQEARTDATEGKVEESCNGLSIPGGYSHKGHEAAQGLAALRKLAGTYRDFPLGHISIRFRKRSLLTVTFGKRRLLDSLSALMASSPCSGVRSEPPMTARSHAVWGMS